MEKYKIHVEGMGFEYGTVCVPCVFAFIDEMKKQKGISEIMFVITERVFYVTSDRLGEKKTRKRIDTALDKAGLTLCKDFRLCSLMVCD
ncbi:hypothetical protein [Seleniivibrio woodruffii]|uniref:hypothetical protein n=1 Tax=Seleniivibrio woodruffii TaxID=1078050 RepID=UPI0026E9816C|nr:hypothetical protein [Seleniivibrio woodruffii]